MRRYPEPDDNDSLTPYRRPALAAWIAAGAVAVAVFLLGGFIKTYQQLETLRDSSRREIEELRLAVAELRQNAGGSPAPTEQRQPRARPAPLPRAGGGGESGRIAPDADAESLRPAPARVSAAGAGGESGNAAPTRVIPEIDLPLRPRMAYAVGRRSDPEALALAEPLGQVVSVASATKRLIIEGGRDVGLQGGARLEIYRDGRWVGDLRAIDVYENQTACEVLHSASDPLPGDMVRLPAK